MWGWCVCGGGVCGGVCVGVCVWGCVGVGVCGWGVWGWGCVGVGVLFYSHGHVTQTALRPRQYIVLLAVEEVL